MLRRVHVETGNVPKLVRESGTLRNLEHPEPVRNLAMVLPDPANDPHGAACVSALEDKRRAGGFLLGMAKFNFWVGGCV